MPCHLYNNYATCKNACGANNTDLVWNLEYTYVFSTHKNTKISTHNLELVVHCTNLPSAMKW